MVQMLVQRLIVQRRKRVEGVIRMRVGGVWEWGSDQLMVVVNNNYIEEPTFVLGVLENMQMGD